MMPPNLTAATQELATVNTELRVALNALPIIADTHDRKFSKTFSDLNADGQSTTAAREWAKVDTLDEARDLAVARARVDTLRERQSLLMFLLEHGLIETGPSVA